MKAIIIHVTNKSTVEKRVKVFDPEYKDNAIVIESGISTLTYKEILRGLFNDVLINLFYATVHKSTGKEGFYPNFSMQHMDLKIESRTIEGLAITESINLGIDPYQQQHGMSIIKKKAILNQLTYFTFNAHPGMKYCLHWYLLEESQEDLPVKLNIPTNQFGETDMKDSVETYVDPKKGPACL